VGAATQAPLLQVSPEEQDEAFHILYVKGGVLGEQVSKLPLLAHDVPEVQGYPAVLVLVVEHVPLLALQVCPDEHV